MAAHLRWIGILALSSFGWAHVGLAGTFAVSSGVWSDPANWNPQAVPIDALGVSYTATINNSDVAMLDIAATISGLTVAAGSQLNFAAGGSLTLGDAAIPIAGTLSNAGTINLNGNTLTLNSLSGPGSFNSSGSIRLGRGTISGVTGSELLTASGSIQGTGSLSNITLSPSAGSTLVLDESQGDTLTVAANAAIGTSGGNILLLGTSGYVALNNQGTVTVGDGNSFTFKADTGGGPFAINNDGSVNLAGGKLVFDNNGVASSEFLVGSFAGTGTLNLSSGLVNSALITSAPGQTTLLTNAQGHTIQGAGTIDGSVSFSNAGSVIANGGTLLIATSADYSAGTQTLGGSNGIFQANDGSTLQIGNIAANAGIVNNYAAIVLDGTGQIRNGAGEDAVTNILTNNYGTLQLQNSAYLALNTNFTNYGNLNVAGNLVTGNSTLDLTHGTFANLVTTAQGTALTGGTYNVSGAIYYSGNDITEIAAHTNLTLSGGGSIVNINSGNPDAISATLNLNNGSLTLASGAFLQLSQSLTNNGTLNVSGDQNGTSTLFALGNMTNTGTLNITGQSSLYLLGTTALTNSGTVFVGTGSFVSASGPVINLSTGSITLDDTNVNGSAALFEASDGFENSGTVVIEGSDANNPVPAALEVAPGSNYVQTGATALTQVDGVLSADEVDVEGGTVTGSGLIEGLLFNNAGTVAAGDAAGSVLSVCNFTQTAGGNLLFTIGGATGYSQLDVGPATYDGTPNPCGAGSGAASLDGNIEFDFTGGFAPQFDQTYDLILSQSLTGDFSSFSFENLDGWTPEFSEQSDELQVAFVTPEPVPAALLTVGLIFLATLRRKRSAEKGA